MVMAVAWVLVAGGPLQAGELSPSVCRITDGGRMSRVAADSKREAFYCSGLVHARERGRQMQVLRQTGRGRLAEDRGPAFLKGDFILRLLELERRAERLAATIEGQDRELLEAYAAGVNASGARWLKRDSWKVSDTVLFLLLQAFDQTRRSFEQDIATDRHARKGHPLERDFPWQTPILKSGEYLRRQDQASFPEKRSSQTVFPFAPEDQASGSNNWVVSARHSKTGKALLANDPHLQLKSPPFWHWFELSWPGVRVVGAGLPGVPLIASGASNHLAWGLTNSYVDVADAVLVPRERLKTRSIWPVVWVKKWGIRWPIFFKRLEVTEDSNLPVLPIEAPVKDHAVVVRWTGFDLQAAELSALWKLGEARNVREFDGLLSQVGLPSWNFVFADTRGEVGYRAIGRLPRRAWREPGTLEVVAPEALGPFEVLSSDEAPHVLNPRRGWVATANQLQWGADGKNSVGVNHTESFRGFRIEELLKRGLSAGHSVDTFRRIQCDTQAVDARFLLPVLLKGMPASERTGELLARLRGWNFEASLECRECALFRAWMELLGDPQWTYARAVEGKPEFWREAEEALLKARHRLASLEGGPWVRWGEVHRAGFPLTEALRPFALARADTLETPGDSHSVAPGSSDWIDGEAFFSQHSGASQRMIVELTSPPTVHWVLPGANRGNGLEQERATSPDRMAWAGCQLRTLTSSSSSDGTAAESR